MSDSGTPVGTATGSAEGVGRDGPDGADRADGAGLKRSISGRLLFFYVLGDVLGSGIYVLIGAVAGVVGGAFWLAFAVGVSVAAITGLAYAELATKYPRAAGAALYVNQAFGSRFLTFLVTVSFLAASFAAAGSLATGFARYFGELWSWPPTLVVAIVFLLCLTVVNLLGITESVVANLVMTVVEVAGLVIIVAIGIWHVVQERPDLGVLTRFDVQEGDNAIFAIVAGVALAFFSMTGFENAVNVAEETVEPERSFPRALIGGMVAAGVIYVLVSVSAALTVEVGTLAGSDVALLEVVKADLVPVPLGFLTILFTVIACVAITNTTLVAVVTQPRILYGMAREEVVPRVFGRIHPDRRSPWVGLVFSALVLVLLLVVGTWVTDATAGDLDLVARLATVTVVFLLFIYALVIVAALRLGDRDSHEHTFRAHRGLLAAGLVGNVVLLGYVVWDDPASLLWCGALVAVGFVLYLVQYAVAGRKGA